MLEAFEGDLDRAWEEENKVSNLHACYWWISFILCFRRLVTWDTLYEASASCVLEHWMKEMNWCPGQPNVPTRSSSSYLPQLPILIGWSISWNTMLVVCCCNECMELQRLIILIFWIRLDVSLADIYQEDYDRARFNIRHSYDSFLSTWTGLHPLAHGSRLSRLGILERVCKSDVAQVHDNLLFMHFIVDRWTWRFPRFGRRHSKEWIYQRQNRKIHSFPFLKVRTHNWYKGMFLTGHHI